MKRMTVIVIFLLLAGTLFMAGDAWRKVNSFSDRTGDLDDTVGTLHSQMNELRSDIKDLHKLYMKQLATLETIDAELSSPASSAPETTETKLLMTPVVKKEPVVGAEEDNSAEKLLSEFVESMEREPVTAQVSREKTSPQKPQEVKLPAKAYARKEPVRKSDGSRQKIVFKTQTDGTLKNKNKVPAAKVPRASAPAKTATVSAKVAKTDNASIGSSNLPVFLDIGSMVSTTATTVVKTEVPKVTVKKPAARITVPRRTSNTVKVAAPGLPGATPVTVKRTQVTTVTPNDLNPNPPKRVRPVAVAKPWEPRMKKTVEVAAETRATRPKKVVKTKPETDPDVFVIDLQNEQKIVESESRIIAGIDTEATISEKSFDDKPDSVTVAAKRVTSVPSVTSEVKAEVVDLRPSQLYKKRKRAADIMRVSMTDQLSSGARRQAKRTMADILDEYDAVSE